MYVKIPFCIESTKVLRVPVVKYLKGRNPLTSGLEGDINIESDCEVDLPGVADALPNTREEKEEKARPVLITGSFATYVYLFILLMDQGE